VGGVRLCDRAAGAALKGKCKLLEQELSSSRQR
jgi:hypothetical protein